jgi:hypothetical protein
MELPNFGQRPYPGVLLIGLVFGFMGISEIYGRLAIELDGRVISATTECVEPQHSRCASVYVVELADGGKQTYVAGPTDKSLKRYRPVGTVIQKRKWELAYRIDGKKINDFPYVFYFGFLSLSVGSLIWWLYLMSKNRSEQPNHPSGSLNSTLASVRESQFGFRYTWEDMRPVRALSIAVLALQILGAAIGLWVAKYPTWFANLWAGGALASLPGFLFGLIVQRFASPGSLSANMVMVRRMGLIAVLMTLSVFIVPLDKHHAG